MADLLERLEADPEVEFFVVRKGMPAVRMTNRFIDTFGGLYRQVKDDFGIDIAEGGEGSLCRFLENQFPVRMRCNDDVRWILRDAAKERLVLYLFKSGEEFTM